MRIDEKARLDEVAVHGVSASSPPSLDLQRDPSYRVECVNFVRKVFRSLLPKQHGATNLLDLPLASFDIEPRPTSPGRRTASALSLVVPVTLRVSISPCVAAKTATTSVTQSGGRWRGG